MDMEQEIYNCYICLEEQDYKNIYFKCNVCVDGNVCNTCSNRIIYSNDYNLFKCGICKTPFDLQEEKYVLFYNFNNMDSIKIKYFIISCIYMLFQAFRINIYYSIYNKIYCPNIEIDTIIYHIINILYLSVIFMDKIFYWRLIESTDLLSNVSIYKILRLYYMLDLFNFCSSCLLFNNIVYRCNYNQNMIFYFYIYSFLDIITFNILKYNIDFLI